MSVEVLNRLYKRGDEILAAVKSMGVEVENDWVVRGVGYDVVRRGAAKKGL